MKIKLPYLKWTTSIPVLTLSALCIISSPAARASSNDLDEDGIFNRLDRDVDGDGVLNGNDRNVDGGICKIGPKAGLFVGDRLLNSSSLELDIDGDGILDGKDDDCDGDGKGRAKDSDDDGDRIDDTIDTDDDNDGLTDDDENEVEAPLAATPDAPAESRVRAKIKLLLGGKITLEFDGRGLNAGDYDVVVDGQILGALSMINDKGRTEGMVRFETNPDKLDELPLPFNPFGLPALIMKDGITYFTGKIPKPTDIFIDDNGVDDNSGEITFTAPLVKAPGLSAEAGGSLEIQKGTNGVSGLEVEVEGIPVGIYDFFVAGVNRGALSVILVKGKPKGKLRYEIVPDGNAEQLLDFPVAGEAIVISQGTQTFFSGNAPTPN